MLMPALIFAASLAALLVAARLFTGAAERIGLRLGLSPFLVGVLIVAVGTSLPELVAAVLSVRAGSSEIVAGNVIGANTTNLLLILGAVAVAVPRGRIVLGEEYLQIDLHFMLGGTIALATAMSDGVVSRPEGLLLLGGYVIYVVYLLTEGRSASAEQAHAEERPMPRGGMARDALFLLGGGVLIYLAGERTVGALDALATALAVPPAVAAVTVLSIGTTLPELAVSVTAARRGNPSLAVGNILGSYIFNAFAVTGTGALIGGVTVPLSLRSFALPFGACAALFFYLLTQDKRISRWEGMVFLLLYGLFLMQVVAAN